VKNNVFIPDNYSNIKKCEEISHFLIFELNLF